MQGHMHVGRPSLLSLFNTPSQRGSDSVTTPTYIELHKSMPAKCLGENVCHLLICLYVLQPNCSSLNKISQDVVPDVYVFALVMENWIL